MSNKYVLVKFEDNWADEMDVYGFKVMPLKDYNLWVENIKENFIGATIYFGTNEENYYQSAEELLDTLEVKEISQNDYISMERLFPEAVSFYGYGQTGIFSIDCTPEEDWDDDSEG